MALFVKKTWKNRLSEYPTRRKLTKENGTTELVTVARSEGTVSQEGDAFSAENMNNLEDRILKAIGTGDIPNELGTDIISAINALNTGCATQIFHVDYTYGGSNGEAYNGLSTIEVAIFGRFFVSIKLPYDIKVAAKNSVIFKLKMNSDNDLNKLLVAGYDVETCCMYDTNNELVPVTVMANAVANNESISFAARTYTITNPHNSELHSVQWRTIPVYFKLFQH